MGSGYTDKNFILKRLNSIQVLRACAGIGVVLYHMLIIEKKYSGGDLILPAFFKIGQAGVDLFFVISGFIMVTITILKTGTVIKTSGFLLHRFARIYPNYWFYFLLTFSVYFFAPGLVNSSQRNQFNFFTSFFLIPSGSLPLVLVGWSLIYEIYFYLVFALLIKLKTVAVTAGLLTWLFVLVLINTFFPPFLNPFIRLLTSPYSIEFILGAFSAFLVRDARLLSLSSKWLFTIILIVVLIIPLLFFNFYSIYPDGLFKQCVVFGLLFSILVTALVLIEKQTDFQFPTLLIKVGDISYTIYLSHVLILGFTGRLWARYFQHPLQWWDNIIIFPLMLVAIISYALVAYRLIEFPLYNFFVKLISGKTTVRKNARV